MSSDDVQPNDDTRSTTPISWLRGPKLNDMAAFDFFATAVAAFFLAGGIKKINNLPFWTLTFILFIVLILMGVCVHVATKTPTMLNHYLGLNTLDEVLESRK